MDVDDALVTPASFGDGSEETKKDTSNKSISSSLSASPSSGLDCDPEVKEGFLCLSEEDDVQPEKDDKSDQSEEKMNVDAVKEDLKDEKTGGENPETQLVNCLARFKLHYFGQNSLIVMRVALLASYHTSHFSLTDLNYNISYFYSNISYFYNFITKDFDVLLCLDSALASSLKHISLIKIVTDFV